MSKFVKKLSGKIRKFRRNYDSNRNIFVVCVSVVMIWKGIWDLLEIYFFPKWPLVSNLVGIGIGIFVLLMDDGRLGELKEEDLHKQNLHEQNIIKEKKKDNTK